MTPVFALVTLACVVFLRDPFSRSRRIVWMNDRFVINPRYVCMN